MRTKEEIISEVAQKLFDAGVESEIEPVRITLEFNGHPLASNWEFIFCVCVEMGHISARAQGYKDQWEMAGEKMRESEAYKSYWRTHKIIDYGVVIEVAVDQET